MGCEMKRDKFIEIYNRSSDLVMKAILEKCPDEQAAVRIFQETYEGYCVRESMLADELVKPWLLWFAQMKAYEYREEQKIERRKAREKEKKARKRWFSRKPRIDDWPIVSYKDDAIAAMAKNHEEERIIEKLREENEEWFQMVYLAVRFQLNEKELAAYLKTSPRALRIELYHAKRFLVNQYYREFKREYQKLRKVRGEEEI